jgi:hypothetical protein
MGDDEFAMISTTWKTATLILLITLCPLANAADPPEVALSPAEAAVISRQIGNLKSSTDANVAMGWSNAKKVAELICRPAALFLLKKQIKGADRVFLGTDAPQTLILESSQRLTGSGQVRTPRGWQDFTFTCNLNPVTAKVIGFQTVPLLGR